LCGLDVGVTEHQLDGADIDAVRQQAAGAFVTQIVPVQVDLLQLGPVDPNAGFSVLRVGAGDDQRCCSQSTCRFWMRLADGPPVVAVPLAVFARISSSSVRHRSLLAWCAVAKR
jgi:hypothetical protein